VIDEMGKGAKRDEDRENRREKGGYEKLGSRAGCSERSAASGVQC